MKYTDLDEKTKAKLTKNKFIIDDETIFTEEFGEYLSNCKHTNVNLVRCSIIISEQDVCLKHCNLTDCDIRYTPVDIVSSSMESVRILNCNFFSIKNSNLNDATFVGGMKEIEQSHPIVYSFPEGTIMNPKPGLIDFFGNIDDYEYFLNRLEEFPYSAYECELQNIIAMGTREKA